MTPIPDANIVSDSEDELVIDLEAITREAEAKLKKDLVDAKVQNDKIAWKQQEQADQRKEVERQYQEDMDKVVAKEKADEATRKKGSVQPPVVSTCLSEGQEADLISSLGVLHCLETQRWGCPSIR